MVRAVRKLLDQPLPFLIAVALTTAALAFGVMDLIVANPDGSAELAATPHTISGVGGESGGEP